MLYQDISYYHFQLESPIVVDGILIEEVYIDPYYEKHNEEFLEGKKEKGIKLTSQELKERIITNEWIIEFVQQLDTQELPNGKKYDKWVYYPREPFWKYHKSYCLIFCLEDGKNYIEVVDCYRESKYERKKWKNRIK